MINSKSFLEKFKYYLRGGKYGEIQSKRVTPEAEKEMLKYKGISGTFKLGGDILKTIIKRSLPPWKD